MRMAASVDHVVAYTIGKIFKHFKRLCAAVFHQWIYKYCPLEPLACRRNTYL